MFLRSVLANNTAIFVLFSLDSRRKQEVKTPGFVFIDDGGDVFWFFCVFSQFFQYFFFFFFLLKFVVKL